MVLHVGRADGADLDAEQRPRQDDHRQADVHHTVERVEDRAAQAHHEGDHQFGCRGRQRRSAEQVDDPGHADEAADRDGRREHAGGETERRDEHERHARVEALEAHHRSGNAHRLHPAGDPRDPVRVHVFARPLGAVQAPGVAQHEAADDPEHDHEHRRNVQAGADVAVRALDPAHHLLPREHAELCEHAHHDPELPVHLPVLVPLERADERLGELVANVGGDRDDAGHPHRHHRGREHERAARADEAAHHASNQSDEEQLQRA